MIAPSRNVTRTDNQLGFWVAQRNDLERSYQLLAGLKRLRPAKQIKKRINELDRLIAVMKHSKGE